MRMERRPEMSRLRRGHRLSCCVTIARSASMPIGLFKTNVGVVCKKLGIGRAIGVARHKEHGRPRGSQLLHGPVDSAPVDVGHRQIADNEVVDGLPQPLKGRLAAEHGLHRMALEDGLNQFGELGLIVHHEDPGHRFNVAPVAEAAKQNRPYRAGCGRRATGAG